MNPLQAPYFYGGLHVDVLDLARPNTEETELSFNGCLKVMRMNNQRLSGPHQAFGLNQCSENMERGVFFADAPRSYAVLRE